MRYTLVHDWMLEIHEGGREIIKSGVGCDQDSHDHSAQEELVRRANEYDRLLAEVERLKDELEDVKMDFHVYLCERS